MAEFLLFYVKFVYKHVSTIRVEAFATYQQGIKNKFENCLQQGKTRAISHNKISRGN